MSAHEYTVGLAAREHISWLAGIERAAAELFPADLLRPENRGSTVPHEQLEAAQAEGRLWTALANGQRPVGFALAVREAGSAFLQEVDVHPDHQQKGLGRQLIRHVMRWAQAQELACVTLTTFEHVAWNAPFYNRLGFRQLAAHELSNELAEHLQAEHRQGLQERVAMQLDVCPAQPNNSPQSTREDLR